MQTMSRIRILFASSMVAMTLIGTCQADQSDEHGSKAIEMQETMFPDGLDYDFGKVPRGIQVAHTFRIVNTSAIPLRLISLRWP